MSVTSAEVNMKGLSQKNSHDGFTVLQALGLILLTIVISVGGWYAVGKYFVWSDLDAKRLNQEVRYFEAKVKADPRNLENHLALGYAYYVKGDNGKAVKEFNQILVVDKKYAGAYFNLGLVYEDEDRLDDAMEMYQKSIELSPKDFKAHLQQGIVYRKLKMYKEAINSLEKANKLMPGRSNVITEIARVAEDKGEFKTAADIYKEALMYDPLNKEAGDGLKRVQNK